ncbi:MAG: CBS domain-containing protein [Candidatus Kapabacteria bacterium]|nr:CBS domain-containing protein [Candidatus Kapabacteria bacterium]
MFLLLSFVFLAIALLFTVIGTIIFNYSSETEQAQNNFNENKKLKILQIRNSNEEKLNAYSTLELLFYSVSAIFASLFFSASNDFYLLIILFFGFLIFFLRAIIISVGIKFASLAIPVLFNLIIPIDLILRPFAFILNFLIKRISGLENSEASLMELSQMVDNAHEEGSIEAGEYRIFKNMIKFNDVIVADIMTPRTVVFSCDVSKKVGEMVKMPELKMYSRIPVTEIASFDKAVVGYVLARDILYAAVNDDFDRKIKSFVRKINFIPENAELDKALDLFLETRSHILIVVDEYGGITGILTMEDLLETILGREIIDEADRVVDMREYAKQLRDRRISTQGV